MLVYILTPQALQHSGSPWWDFSASMITRVNASKQHSFLPLFGYLSSMSLESPDQYTCNMVHVGPFSFLACFLPVFVLEPMFQSLLLGDTLPSSG